MNRAILILLLSSISCFAEINSWNGVTVSTGTDFFGSSGLASRNGSTLKAAGGGATCDTARDSYVGVSSVGTVNVGSSSGNIHVAQKFTAAATTTICKAVLRLDKTGTPAFNVFVGIWSHNGGSDEPSTLISESSAIASSTIGGTVGNITFTDISASLTASTIYWVVIRTSTSVDTSNCVRWERSSDATEPSNSSMQDGDGTGPWSLTSASRTQHFALFSE